MWTEAVWTSPTEPVVNVSNSLSIFEKNEEVEDIFHPVHPSEHIYHPNIGTNENYKTAAGTTTVTKVVTEAPGEEFGFGYVLPAEANNVPQEAPKYIPQEANFREHQDKEIAALAIAKGEEGQARQGIVHIAEDEEDEEEGVGEDEKDPGYAPSIPREQFESSVLEDGKLQIQTKDNFLVLTLRRRRLT